MKVMHINTFSEGGAAKACLRLHSGLLKMGVDSKVLVLYSTPLQADIPEVYDYKKLALNSFLKKLSFRIKESFRWRYLQYLLKGKPKEFDIFSTLCLHHNITHLKIFKEADIINLHWVANFLNYDELSLSNKKIVWTLHDMNAFTGGCHYTSGCKQFLNHCYECPQLEGTKHKHIVKSIFHKKQKFYSKNNIVFITPSQWLCETAKKSHLLAEKNIFHIPYGIDTKVFKPFPKIAARNAFGLPIDKKNIIFVSDSLNNRRKGLHLLMQVLEGISDPDILLCAIGKGKESVNEKIIYLGKILDENKMALAYSSANLFVIPSLEDNLPNTVLEAMACGIPVVGFNTGGIPEMVINGENGYIVEKANVDEMKNNIFQLVNNKDLLVKFASKNRERIVLLYSLEKQAKEYLHLYQKILS